MISSLSKAREILNVQRDITQDELKRAYKNTAKLYHPDSVAQYNPGLPRAEAEEKFKEIVEAYEAIKYGKLPETEDEKSEFRKIVNEELYQAYFANIKKVWKGTLPGNVWHGKTKDVIPVIDKFVDYKSPIKSHEQIVAEYTHKRHKFLSDVTNARLKVHIIVSKGKKFFRQHKRAIILTTSLLAAILGGRYLWNYKKRAYEKRMSEARARNTGLSLPYKKMRRRR